MEENDNSFKPGTFVRHKLNPEIKMLVLSKDGMGMTHVPMTRVRLVNSAGLLSEGWFETTELEITPKDTTCLK